ncbi:MAG: dephospho-CoA kinase [Candidatus Omnitrophica bacterium]|nr:dephospho-CoA kinase [Candidatus Omnitrophota bacterium]
MSRQRKEIKVVIGLTGSFGSGKSTVAGIFKKGRACVIDADSLAHECLRPGSAAYKKIISIFGKGILCANKMIDRKRLGEGVFNDHRLLLKLNSIIHPEVIRRIRRSVRAAKSGLIVLDAPLLIEAGLHKEVDKVVVVAANQNNQIKRLQRRCSLNRAGILKRINSQIPLKKKISIADFVIDNDGSLAQTKKQVDEIRRVLLWKRWRN